MKSSWQPTKLCKALAPVSRPESIDPIKKYRLLGIRLDGGGPFLRETISGSQSAATRLFKVKAGDFIYSRLFAWRGAFGVIASPFDDCYVSGEFPTFRPISDIVDPEFLRLWFRLPSTIKQVEGNCTGSTPLTRNRFRENFFLNLEIPLPTPSGQRRIVERIETLTAKIEETRKLKKQIEQDSDKLLLGTFYKLISSANEKPMQEIAPITRRPVEIDTASSYPEIGIRSFGKGTFHKPNLSGWEVGSKKLYKVQAGDILFNNVFAWEGAIAVVQPEDTGRVGSHRFIACVPKKKVVTANFLRFYFLAEEGLEKIGLASPGGAGGNRTLGLEKLEAITVPIPSFEKQLWFDKLQFTVEKIRKRLSQTYLELDALLPSILDKAFRGRL